MRRHALLALGFGLLILAGHLLAGGDAKDEAVKKDRKR